MPVARGRAGPLLAVTATFLLAGCFLPPAGDEKFGGETVISGWVFESTLERGWDENWSWGRLYLLTDAVNTEGVEKLDHCFLVQLVFSHEDFLPGYFGRFMALAPNDTFRDAFLQFRASTEPTFFDPPRPFHEEMGLLEVVTKAAAPAGRVWAEQHCNVTRLPEEMGMK